MSASFFWPHIQKLMEHEKNLNEFGRIDGPAE